MSTDVAPVDAIQTSTEILPAKKVVAAIPCLNEERNIGDDTSLIAKAAGAIVVRHETNQGKGAALNSAFSMALGRNADVLVLIDGDGQHRPSEIPRVVAPILSDDADISVGSRHLALGGIPKVRRVGQTMVTAATNLGSGVNLTDSQSGFRAFSRRALEALSFTSRGFAVESEMQFLALDHNLRVVEVPIEAVYVDPPKRNVFRHGFIILDGLMRLAGMHRPLLFFAAVGLSAWFVGALMAIMALESITRGSAAAAPTLGAIICLLLGVLSVFAGVILHSVRAMMMMHLR